MLPIRSTDPDTKQIDFAIFLLLDIRFSSFHFSSNEIEHFSFPLTIENCVAKRQVGCLFGITYNVLAEKGLHGPNSSCNKYAASPIRRCDTL
jgi:hypothetical protein